MSDMKTYVEALIEKAAEHPDANEALKFSQAATNAANAISTLYNCGVYVHT